VIRFGWDGALRRPRRVQRRNWLVWLARLFTIFFPLLRFVPPAERGRGHRSAMSPPTRRSI